MLSKSNRAPEKLDLVGDNWASQPDNRVPSPFYGLYSASQSSSLLSAEKSLPSTPSSSNSFTGRRWGIFSKKAPTSSSKLDSRKKPKHNVLKKQHTKSTPTLVLRPGNLANAPYDPNDLPPPPSTAGSDLTLWDEPLSQSPGSAIYFTVDPYWDPSKGDADVYLLPLPEAIEPSMPQCAMDTAPHPRARTHVCKPPRSLKSVVKTDNETSFLFLK